MTADGNDISPLLWHFQNRMTMAVIWTLCFSLVQTKESRQQAPADCRENAMSRLRLRPGDKPEFVGLNEVWMRRYNAHVQAIRATLGRWDHAAIAVDACFNLGCF